MDTFAANGGVTETKKQSQDIEKSAGKPAGLMSELPEKFTDENDRTAVNAHENAIPVKTAINEMKAAY